jgi:hypothetical protein
MAELKFGYYLEKYFEKDDNGFIDFYHVFIRDNKHDNLTIHDLEKIYKGILRDKKINDLLK